MRPAVYNGPTMATFRSGMTRREALGVLGAAAASPLVAQSGVTFPKGAVIRTLLRDLDPAELAGVATLFH